MSTLVTVWNYNGFSYAILIKEELPLGLDMIKLLDGSYCYTISTCYTRDIISRNRIKNAINHMRSDTGNIYTAQQVSISTSEDCIIFVNPRIEFYEERGDLFMELRCGTIEQSHEIKKRRRVTFTGS